MSLSSTGVKGARGARGYARTLMSPPAEPGSSAPLLDVDPLAVELGERFRSAGHQLYLVGGAVRDLILQRPARGEFDFATDAKPQQTIQVLRDWADVRYLQGVRYGTVGARKGDRTVEVTTFRKEVYPEQDR